MIEPLPYLFRVVHILSAILLLGGLFYAWNLSKARMLPSQLAAGFQPAVVVLVVLLFGAGAYNLMLKMGQPGLPKMYHMVFGIKFLLFLHIAAVSLILVKPTTTDEKRGKLLFGVAASGTVVVLLSSALRALSMN